MDGVVLRSVNHVWPLKCFPKFQPLRRSWEDLADPWPEPCDVGSFKLLGWELLITGTWNCLTHASPNCTTARQRTQPNPNPARPPPSVCLGADSPSPELLVVQRDGDTNCLFLNFGCHMRMRNTCAVNLNLKMVALWFSHVWQRHDASINTAVSTARCSEIPCCAAMSCFT